MYYTYAYLREDGTPFYIGKGKDGRINKQGTRSFQLPPIDRRIFLKQNLTEEEALRHEAYIIDVIGKENLINKTTGGQGISGLKHTPETKEKCREAASKAKRNTDKWRATREANGWKTKREYSKATDETREKMRQAQTGRKHSPETRKKMSETAKKRKTIDNILNNTHSTK